jgi:DNA repair protein RecO (recombination protein O)
MLHKTKAIVLHTLKYNESGIILHAYTDVFGRQSFLIHGVRKKNSRINASLFQPLSLLEIEANIKENRELQRVKEVKSLNILYGLQNDIRRSAIAIFLSELLYKTLREVEPNQKLFDYLFHSVQILEITENGIENFHLIFLMQFTKFIGIFPGDDSFLQTTDNDKKFNLLKLLDYSLSETTALKLNSLARVEILNQLVGYYKNHFEGIGNIHSLKILQEVFH